MPKAKKRKPKPKLRYCGITYPSLYAGSEAQAYWKEYRCPAGEHLFDEVLGEKEHYLHCDACGLKVYISRIEG